MAFSHLDTSVVFLENGARRAVLISDGLAIVVCYAKATSVGRRFSEGGTHEEMLRPQDLKGELGSQRMVDGD